MHSVTGCLNINIMESLQKTGAFLLLTPFLMVSMMPVYSLSLEKEVIAVTNPVGEIVTKVGSSQCSHVKRILGISYEQMEGSGGPDVSTLKIVHKTKSFTKIYNISYAAEALRLEGTLDSRVKLVIFVHGFIDDPSKESFTTISNAYLNSDEGDVITLLALDCSSLIRWFYLRSSTIIIYIGYALADMIKAMILNGLQHSNIHLVGHSLGAHTCGFAGKKVFEQTGILIGRITGLDPAGPCFTHVSHNHRLNSTDAAHVDNIHTDSGIFGMKDAIGHADYYPNEGKQQPGCLLQDCSHVRAWRLWAESILNRFGFPAVRCDNWESFTRGQCDVGFSYMGLASTPETRGLYYLQTAGSSPFALGQAGARYNNNEGIVRNILG